MKQRSPKKFDEALYFLERLGQSYPLVLGLVPREGGHQFGPQTSPPFSPSIFDLAKSIPWCNSISALHCGLHAIFQALDVVGEAHDQQMISGWSEHDLQYDSQVESQDPSRAPGKTRWNPVSRWPGNDRNFDCIGSQPGVICFCCGFNLAIFSRHNFWGVCTPLAAKGPFQHVGCRRKNMVESIDYSTPKCYFEAWSASWSLAL